MGRWGESEYRRVAVNINPCFFQGFIIPQLLSVEECEEVIQLGEDWGIGEEDVKVPQDKRIRTSNRTNSYVNEELTIRYQDVSRRR